MRSQELKHCSGSLQEHVFDSKLEANTSGTTDALSPLGELLPADEHATSENILKDIAISSLRLTPHADHYLKDIAISSVMFPRGLMKDDKLHKK